VALGYEGIFEPGDAKGTWTIKKKANGACSQLGDDGLCVIHAAHGEQAKPLVCQRFPFVHVASDEHVWVSASYGSKAVSEGIGEPLKPEEAQRLFEKDLSEADPSSGTVYPMDEELRWTTEQLDQALEAFDWGSDLFAAMRRLAAFPTGSNADPAPSQANYAFVLTLYADLLDLSSILSRLRGVFVLPKALNFTLKYHSRFLGIDVDMAQVQAHPGTLPPESHELLIRWIRGNVRGRRIFKSVPFATAGITRLLLQADAVLYFARALAIGREIEHQDVLRALREVEFNISHQLLTTLLYRLDPRLPVFWQNRSICNSAAALLAPAVKPAP